MIQISSYSIRVNKFQLSNINLKISEREVFAILGKTGSGKTMLLESIAGFYRGDSGSVSIQGTNVADIEPERRRIGFVYQDLGLFPHMTVYENIQYGLRMQKVPKKSRSGIVYEMAQTLGITDILDQYPGTLSGGERQRTALARALVLKPEILLMDEPFSALDPKTRKKMYELIEKIHSTFRCTILFVTHNYHEAIRMAQRIGIMVNGELRTVCKAESLIQMYRDLENDEFLGGDLD